MWPVDEHSTNTPIRYLLAALCLSFPLWLAAKDLASIGTATTTARRAAADPAVAANTLAAEGFDEFFFVDPESHSAPPADRLDEQRARGWRRPDNSWYPVLVNDGLELLRANTEASHRVFVLDWVDPFNALLGRQGVRGVACNWHVGRIYNGEVFPSQQNIWDSMSHVLLPLFPLSKNSQNLLFALYAKPVQAGFREVARSKYFVLYGRR